MNSLIKLSHCLLRLSYSNNCLPGQRSSLAITNFFSTSLPSNELKIQKILDSTFPNAKSIVVKDISGGCGAMYEIFVEAPQFKGLTIVKQHKLITDALKEEIKDMHGLRIHTSTT